MPLELDQRQRAMLQEMGVHVWLPGPEFEPERTAAPMPAVRDRVATLAARSTIAPVQPLPSHQPVQPVQVVRPQRSAVAEPMMPSAHPAPNAQALALDGAAWQALADSAAGCQACGLCAGRKQTTLQPLAAAQADWFFVGDPPDEDEDRLGAAFSEQAGQLMDNMLKAMGATRGTGGASGAYLTNIVKCRPPLGRLPVAAEFAQCAQYLRRELALVQPKVIIAMGRSATLQLLGEHPDAIGLPLGKQRGVVYRYAGLPVVVTYAPSVLLRTAADKAKAWADLCLALDVRAGLHDGSDARPPFNP